MMQFLPLVIGPIVSATVAIAIFGLVVFTFKPSGRIVRSPHHRWNIKADLIAAQERAVIPGPTGAVWTQAA